MKTGETVCGVAKHVFVSWATMPRSDRSDILSPSVPANQACRCLRTRTDTACLLFMHSSITTTLKILHFIVIAVLISAVVVIMAAVGKQTK